ncbi:alpha/beta hydrolase [Williamsoniiplasma somnilux]|uniref:Alpha/beta hydrolase n=1 Tax=Williamsoniiplasma somnilux TaxID=215578 RepID=A0A2K8P1X8_9MOLU|nr:alpha/beta fold hydrolase [Williamsoniiplasma somnilux]ATZ19011.1 alpha/beta hydrolase [Williamsoniiplasma somnilux]
MKKKRNIFKKINIFFQHFYKYMETPFSLGNNKSHIYMYPELRKMNKIMSNFYRHKDLQIIAFDNLVPFKFETEDGVVIDAMEYITDPKSDKWIISSHWFAGNKYWALYWAKPFIVLGYNILVYDFRNHGASEKSDVTMGLKESYDLLGAMNWLKNNKKYKTLGLMGVSMGAFTTNYVLAKHHDKLADYKVKFAISDVTYGSISTLLAHVRNTRFKHSLWKKSTIKVVNAIIKSQSEVTNCDWRDIDIFKYYEKENVPAKVPTFFSAGANDKVVPFADTYRIFVLRSQKNHDDEILVYDWSAHTLALKSHHNKQIYHWLKFENKIIKNDIATKKALEFFGISEEFMKKNPEEKKEIYTLHFNSSESK